MSLAFSFACAYSTMQLILEALHSATSITITEVTPGRRSRRKFELPRQSISGLGKLYHMCVPPLFYQSRVFPLLLPPSCALGPSLSPCKAHQKLIKAPRRAQVRAHSDNFPSVSRLRCFIRGGSNTVPRPSISLSVPPPTRHLRMTVESADAHITHLFDLLSRQNDSNYIGENISQLAHCLQAAHLAVISTPNCHENTAIAALLHDIGQILPWNLKDEARKTHAQDMVDEEGMSVGRVGHEAIGESYLRAKGWPDFVCSLVGAHVMAKRYVCCSSLLLLLCLFRLTRVPADTSPLRQSTSPRSRKLPSRHSNNKAALSHLRKRSTSSEMTPFGEKRLLFVDATMVQRSWEEERGICRTGRR